MSTITRWLRLPMLLALAAALLCLPSDTQAGSGNWVKKVVTYSNLSAAATTGTYTIYTTRAVEEVERVVVRLDTEFAGGAITAYTASVGKSGAAAKFMPAIDVFTGASTGEANKTYSLTAGGESRGTAIIVTATSTGANTSAATAGQITVYLLVSNLPAGT